MKYADLILPDDGEPYTRVYDRELDWRAFQGRPGERGLASFFLDRWYYWANIDDRGRLCCAAAGLSPAPYNQLAERLNLGTYDDQSPRPE